MKEKELFEKLFFAATEKEVDRIINNNPEIFNQNNWYPYGDNESFFGVIENQQASPVPALVEKITNSIDAILTRKCYEAGITLKLYIKYGREMKSITSCNHPFQELHFLFHLWDFEHHPYILELNEYVREK